MDGFGEVVTDRAFAAPATVPAVRPKHEPEVLSAAARAKPSARRSRRPLLMGLAASAAVHALVLAALVQTRVGEAEPAPPPPVYLELPAPFPLPMEAVATDAPPTEPPVEAVEPAPSAPSPEHPSKTSVATASPTPATPLVEPVRARTVEPVRPVTPTPVPAPTRRLGATPPAAAARASEPDSQPPSPPPPSAPAPVSDAGYEGRVMTKLAQAKRYPTAARARREEGTAQVRFTVSRQGRVSGVSLARSSGSTTLDREAMDTVRRAQPLPPVPEGMTAPMQMTLGVAFTLR